jgi:hypothetical protein
MAGKEPLLQKSAAPKRAKLSVLYGADEYLEELKKKYEVDHEIAALKPSCQTRGILTSLTPGRPKKAKARC